MPGRNDSCPCGSGRKYKKCCMRNNQNNRNQRIVAIRGQQKRNMEFARQYCTAYQVWGLRGQIEKRVDVKR